MPIMPLAARPTRKPTRAAIASDAFDAAQIARAVSFTAHIRKGPFEKYTVAAATAEDARIEADKLNAAYGGAGRRAMVYAVTPEGWTFPGPAMPLG